MPNLDDAESFVEHMNEHMELVTPPHRAAFRADPPASFNVGDIVWLWDSYNTGRILSQACDDNSAWDIETWNSNGVRELYTYKTEWLRPADKEYIFKWAEK